MTDSPIKVVLDATALYAYAHGSINVGEILAEVADEGARYAVSSLSLIEAGMELGPEKSGRIDVLLANSRCVRLDLPSYWREMAATARRLGSVQRAGALWWADEHDGYVLSSEPAAYGDDADTVIGI